MKKQQNVCLERYSMHLDLHLDFKNTLAIIGIYRGTHYVFKSNPNAMHCGLVVLKLNALLFFSILSLIFRTTITIFLRLKLVDKGCLSLTFEKGGSIISLHTESRCIRYSEKLPPLPCLLHDVSRASL